MTRAAPATVFTAALLCAVGCPAPVEPIAPIEVGVLNPQSGALGSLGPSWEDAARLAAEQVNAAGGLFDGRPLELVFLDTESNAQRAAERAADLVDRGVAAVVGPASSAEALATDDVFASAQIPQVSCCATSPDLTDAQPARDRWFFRTTPNDLLQGRALAHIATQGFAAEGEEVVRPCAEAVVVHRGDAYGRRLAEVFEQAYAGRTVEGGGTSRLLAPAVSYDPAAPDFAVVADAVEAALASHDDAAATEAAVCIALVAFAPDGLAALQAIMPVVDEADAADGVDDLPFRFLATDGLNDAAFASQAGLAGTFVVGTAPTHSASAAYDEFAKAYEARFGAPPGNLTFTMYDATMLTALAITASESTDGRSIRDALFDVSRGGQVFEGSFFGEMAEALLRGADIDYAGPSGPLDFDDSGDVRGDYQVWRPRQESGGYVIEVVGSLPADVFAAP